MKLQKTFVTVVGLAVILAMIAPAQAVNLDYASAEAAIGGWDYAFTGDADSNGDGTTGGSNKLDGTFAGIQNRWDGSAPGVFGDPSVDPNSDSPGGVDAVVGSGADAGVNYLRIQDTGEPSNYAGTSGASNWNSNTDSGKIYLFHNTEQDVVSSNDDPIISDGITISFRARIATTGTLDDQYPQSGNGTLPWPVGGKGFRIGGSGRAMFTINQGGFNQMGFSLLTTSDIQDSTQDFGLTGGLYMNNQDAAPDNGTSDATVATANFVPISDASLTDWHEFWILIEQGVGGMFTNFKATVYMDGGTTPVGTFTDIAASVDSGAITESAIAIGGGSGSGWGAWDTDFFAYKLGLHAPVPEPATFALGLMGLVGLGFVGFRHRSR